MLYTNLKHIMTADEHQKLINEHENVMVCCGRMGPMCIPVYGIMEDIQDQYPHVLFADMEFDNPEAWVIRDAPEVKHFMGIPFTMYYRNGKLVKATSSIQNMNQITTILEQEFKTAEVIA
jgi:thioredoxin 1